MENTIPSIARGAGSAELYSSGKHRQPDASPTRMRAISPPRNKAASIHSTTGGRLRINPRGGSFCRAKSSDSASLSSARRRSPAPDVGVLAGSWGSSLNLRGTATMLAPKKSGRQGIVHHRSIREGHLASVNDELLRETAPCAHRALARQNSNQRECHDCPGEDCQRHPSPQPRMRFRQAEQMNRGILPVENFRAGRALRRREYFRRRRPSLGGNSACTFGSLAGHRRILAPTPPRRNKISNEFTILYCSQVKQRVTRQWVLSRSMNRELNHHQCDDGSREDRQHQPPRDALVPISQLPNVGGKARRSINVARGLFSKRIELHDFSGSRH